MLSWNFYWKEVWGQWWTAGCNWGTARGQRKTSLKQDLYQSRTSGLGVLKSRVITSKNKVYVSMTASSLAENFWTPLVYIMETILKLENKNYYEAQNMNTNQRSFHRNHICYKDLVNIETKEFQDFISGKFKNMYYGLIESQWKISAYIRAKHVNQKYVN